MKGNAVASNPSREALFDAHWQKPGSGYSGFPCVSKHVRVLLSGEFHVHTGPNNSDAWLLLGALASFHLQFTALLQSVRAAVHQRKQNAKVFLHRHNSNAGCKLANSSKQRKASDSCVPSEDN